jgi:hypothetical protein
MPAGFPFFDPPTPVKPGQLPTIGSAGAYQAAPISAADAQAQYAAAQRQQALADSLLHAGYVPNSGALGALAMMAQAFAGKKLSRKADQKVADALREKDAADQAEEAKKMARAAAAEEVRWNRNRGAQIEDRNYTAAHRAGTPYTDASGKVWSVQGANAVPVTMGGGQAPNAPPAPASAAPGAQFTLSDDAIKAISQVPVQERMAMLSAMATGQDFHAGPGGQAVPGLTPGAQATMPPPQGQQLRGPLPASERTPPPAEFERKAAYLRAHGVPEAQITQMVIGSASGLGDAATTQDPLAGLSPAIADLVKRLAWHEVIPDPRLIGTAQGRDLLGRAGLLNPNFDVRTARASAEFVKGLANSSPTSNGGAVQGINNAFPHLARLLAASNDPNSGLAQEEGVMATLNPVENFWAKNVSHKPGPNSWNTEAQLAAQEIQKMIKGGVATEAETRDMLATLSPNLAPSQRKDAILKIAQFMADKVNGLESRRSQLIGDSAAAKPLMSPAAQAAMDAIFKGGGLAAPDAKGAAAPAKPPTIIRYDAKGNRIP